MLCPHAGYRGSVRCQAAGDREACNTVSTERVRPLNARPQKTAGPAIYWMQRDMRVRDNWTSLQATDQTPSPLAETLPCELVAETASGATMHVEVMPCNWSW